MGRGRQKAKHTKVARELKYFSPDTDYSALQQELGGNGSPVRSREDVDATPPKDDDADEDEWGFGSSR